MNYLSDEASKISSLPLLLWFLNLFNAEELQKLASALVLELLFTIFSIANYKQYIYSI